MRVARGGQRAGTGSHGAVEAISRPTAPTFHVPSYTGGYPRPKLTTFVFPSLWLRLCEPPPAPPKSDFQAELQHHLENLLRGTDLDTGLMGVLRIKNREITAPENQA
jgi:hypothetical protein